jgi:hypothetical protein
MHDGVWWLLWSPPGVCSIVAAGLFLMVFSFFLERRLSEGVRLSLRLLGAIIFVTGLIWLIVIIILTWPFWVFEGHF